MASASPGVTWRSMSRRMTSSPVPLFTVLPMPLATRTLRTLLLFFMLLPAVAAGKNNLLFGGSPSAGYWVAVLRGRGAPFVERLEGGRNGYNVPDASVPGGTHRRGGGPPRP